MFPYVFVTQSADKIAELEFILGESIESEYIELPEIQSVDLESVCREKARYAYKALGNHPVLVEDTGLFINAWNGLPGALTKWFLKTVDLDGISQMLNGFQDRSAVARTAVALYDGQSYRMFIGEVEGSISATPLGENGFGWDALFIPCDSNLSFGQMTLEEKTAYSMRRKAILQMLDNLQQELSGPMPIKKYKYRDLSFVSTSQGKCEEFKRALGIADLKWTNLGMNEPAIFELHALVEEKVDFFKPKIGDKPFIVEHSGLFIDALKGMPGGMTSAFLKRMGNDGICQLLSSYSEEERTARGGIAIGFNHPELGLTVFTAEVLGKIAAEPRGDRGFGWDSIFIPRKRDLDGYYDKTYGEMTPDEKAVTDMRTKAIAQLREHISVYFVF